MKTLDYLEALRAMAPKPSVYAVAQLLGLKEQTVREWSKGRSHPDAYACALIAQALDLPIEQVLSDVQAESEKNPERKRHWEALARKYAACVVAGLITTISPSDGHSATGHDSKSGASSQGQALLKLDYVQIMRLWSLVCRVLKAFHLEVTKARGFGRFPGPQIHGVNLSVDSRPS